jgi:hypothetical protein
MSKSIDFKVTVMKRLALAFTLFAASLGAAHATSATTPKQDGNACIFISTVGQYRSLDRNNLVVWAPGRRDAYLVELSMPLFALESSFQLAMIDNDHDGRLCGYSMDRIGVRDFGRPETSSIRRMTKLDDAGIAELEQKYAVQLKPKKKGEKPVQEQAEKQD